MFSSSLQAAPKCAFLAVIMLMAIPSQAIESGQYAYANVVNTTPVYERYEQRIPQKQCRIETVQQYHPRHQNNQYRRHSATPTLVGSVIGGAIGHAVGRGKKNKRMGTAVGAILGASIGKDTGYRNVDPRENIESRVSYQDVERCEVRHRIETRRELVGYDVDYEYQGRLYSTRMERDPGDKLKVAVTVSPVE